MAVATKFTVIPHTRYHVVRVVGDGDDRDFQGVAWSESEESADRVAAVMAEAERAGLDTRTSRLAAKRATA